SAATARTARGTKTATTRPTRRASRPRRTTRATGSRRLLLRLRPCATTTRPRPPSRTIRKLANWCTDWGRETGSLPPIFSRARAKNTSKRSRAMALRIQKGNEVHPSATKDRLVAPVSDMHLVEELNHDLAGEYQAIIMYTQYSAKLTGPYRDSLRALFQKE